MDADAEDDRCDPILLRILRDGLTSGGLLREGRLLAERELAARLAVSRTRLRRALDRMEKDGAIFRRQGQGTYPRPPPLPHAPRLRSLTASVTPQQVMEVRLEIEPALAALAAERATTDGIAQLESFLVATQTWISLESYERADDIFHYKIARMADNPLFLSIFEEIRAVRRGAAWLQAGGSGQPSRKATQASSQHADIWAAIASRDPAGAGAAMRCHLVHVSNARRQAGDGGSGP